MRFIASSIHTHCFSRFLVASVPVVQSEREFLVDQISSLLRTVERLRNLDSFPPEKMVLAELIGVTESRDAGTIAKAALGLIPGQFEEQLRDLVAKLKQNDQRSSRGRPRNDRSELISCFAIVFEEAGGLVAAGYRHDKGTVDSPFIRFIASILMACGEGLRDSLGTGLAYEVRKFLRSSRNLGLNTSSADNCVAMHRTDRLRRSLRCDEFPTEKSEIEYRKEMFVETPIGQRGFRWPGK